MDSKVASGFLGGQLLIAMPGIGDPRFEHSVILMCSHSPGGAMGIVLNRPARDLSAEDLFRQIGIKPGPEARLPQILMGGPVERGRGFVLHSTDYALADTLRVTEEIALTASLDILRDLARGNGPERAFLALGYAGWGPGQLEGEIRANGWLTCPADAELVLGADPEPKWAAALGRLGIEPTMLSRAGGMA